MWSQNNDGRRQVYLFCVHEHTRESTEPTRAFPIAKHYYIYTAAGCRAFTSCRSASDRFDDADSVLYFFIIWTKIEDVEYEIQIKYKIDGSIRENGTKSKTKSAGCMMWLLFMSSRRASFTIISAADRCCEDDTHCASPTAAWRLPFRLWPHRRPY